MVGETQRSLSRTRSSCMDTTTSPQAAPSPDAYSTVTRIHDSECGSRSKPMVSHLPCKELIEKILITDSNSPAHGSCTEAIT